MSANKKVLIALAGGILLGMLLQKSEIPHAVKVVSVLLTLGTLWTNTLAMTVVPLVLAGIVTAFASGSDSRIIGRLGVLSGLGYALLLLLSGAVALLVSPIFLSLIPAANWPGPDTLERSLGIGSLGGILPRYQMVYTDLVPSNPVRVAVEGAIFPLVVFAVALGAAVTRVSAQSRQKLTRFFAGVSDTLTRLVEMVMTLAPIAVFILALGLGVRFGAGAVGASAVYIVLVGLLCILMAVLLYPVAAVTGRISLARFGRACLQPQIIALMSGSSQQALPASILAAERELGVAPPAARTVLPIGHALFSAGRVVSLVAGGVLLAHLFQLELPLPTLISLVGSATIVSITAPHIVAGPVIVMAPFYFNAGIPAEGIGVLMGLEAIPLAFQAALNVTGHLTVAVAVGGRQPQRNAGTAIPTSATTA